MALGGSRPTAQMLTLAEASWGSYLVWLLEGHTGVAAVGLGEASRPGVASEMASWASGIPAY